MNSIRQESRVVTLTVEEVLELTNLLEKNDFDEGLNNVLVQALLTLRKQLKGWGARRNALGWWVL